MNENYGGIYNSDYYHNYNGSETGRGEYASCEQLIAAFARIAAHLVELYHPQTVLDIGCASGLLVNALRQLGVEAFGVDVSEYAIQTAPDAVREFCIAADVTKGLPPSLCRRFDLVTNLEMAEHLHEEDLTGFLDVLCESGDRIVFSSSPSDFTERTHFNVQQPEYWCKKFAQHGFYRNLFTDLTCIAPWAMVFERTVVPTQRLVENYERQIRLATTKSNEYETLCAERLNLLLEERTQSFAENKVSLQSLQNKNQLLSQTLSQTQHNFAEYQTTANAQYTELAYYKNSYHAAMRSTSWRLSFPLRFIKRLFTGTRPLPAPPQSPTLSFFPLHDTPETVPYDEYHKRELRLLHALNIVHLHGNTPRINLVTENIAEASLFGGVATALIVVTQIARALHAPLRIITRGSSTNPVDYKNIVRLNGVAPLDEVTFYSDFERDLTGDFLTKLEVTDADAFFATNWWTAYALRRTFPAKRLFWLLQDIETYFHDHGDLHLFCTQMLHDTNIKYLVNSHYLWQYFETHAPNVAANGTYFEPAFNPELYQPSAFVKKKRYKLFFYARPGNSRNLYWFGLSVLHKALQQNLLPADEWDIIFAGGATPQIEFAPGVRVQSMGVMPWQTYGTFLSDIDLTLSLMYTPHPSYPPYDAAMSGSVVLSNCYENKQSFPCCENVLLAPLEETAFLETFAKAVALAKNPAQRKQNFEQHTIAQDWQKTLAHTVATVESWLA